MSREKMYQVSVLGGRTHWLVLESRLIPLLREIEIEGLVPDVKECDRSEFNRMKEWFQST